MARRAKSQSSRTARFVARIYRVSLIRYVDVPEVAATFKRSWVPVRASVNGVAFRGTLVPRGGGRYRLPLNAEVRKAGGGVDAGDDVVVTVRATTPHPMPLLPRELVAALEGRPGGRLAFEAWPGGRRRAVVAWLNEARGDDTRARRVQRILDRLGL